MGMPGAANLHLDYNPFTNNSYSLDILMVKEFNVKPMFRRRPIGMFRRPWMRRRFWRSGCFWLLPLMLALGMLIAVRM